MKIAGNIDEDNMKKYFQDISTMMILKKNIFRWPNCWRERGLPQTTGSVKMFK